MKLGVPGFEAQRTILFELQTLCEQRNVLDERIEKADSMHPAIKKKYINTYNKLLEERETLLKQIKELRAQFTRWVLDEAPALKSINETTYTLVQAIIGRLPPPENEEQRRRAQAATVIFYEAALLDSGEIAESTCKLLKEVHKHGV